MKGHVVVVHGLWMNRLAMLPIARRLQQHGWNTYRFGYRSVTASLSENAKSLSTFLQNTFPDDRNQPVHLVAHSLGGLLCRQLIADRSASANDPNAEPVIRHIINLGTPHQGSVVAKRLAASFIGKKALGKSRQALTEQVPPVTHPSTAVIAGTTPVGLGRLVFSPTDPSDGTVLVNETHTDGLAEHITLATTHFGMLFSKEVATHVAHYLEHGRFS